MRRFLIENEPLENFQFDSKETSKTRSINSGVSFVAGGKRNNRQHTSGRQGCCIRQNVVTNLDRARYKSWLRFFPSPLSFLLPLTSFLFLHRKSNVFVSRPWRGSSV